MAEPVRSIRRHPRGPSVLYSGVSLTLVVLLASVALTARQPPPPSIAEFAPQAVEQITDAPAEQSSNAGRGPGGGAGLAGDGGSGAGLGTSTTAPPTADTAAAKVVPRRT